MADIVLERGNYLLELEITRPVSPELLGPTKNSIEHVLSQSGFTDILFDPGFCRPTSDAEFSCYRLVSKLNAPATLRNMPGLLQWKLVHKLEDPASSGINPYAPAMMQVGPIKLETGQGYVARIFTKNKVFPTREKLWSGLRSMGFEPRKLVELRSHMRIPGQPGQSYSQWLYWGGWLGPSITLAQNNNMIIDQLVPLSAGLQTTY